MLYFALKRKILSYVPLNNCRFCNLKLTIYQRNHYCGISCYIQHQFILFETLLTFFLVYLFFYLVYSFTNIFYIFIVSYSLNCLFLYLV